MKKHGINRRGAKGQAIILMALSMVAILSFVGLAVDGGRLLELRRRAQNAADAAATAAALALCQGREPIAEAKRVAFANGQWKDVVVIRSPIGMGVDHPEEFTKVIVYASEPSSFMLVVGVERLDTQAEGLGRCVKDRVMANNAALFAMSDSCQDSLMISGSNITVNGATVSNSDAKFSSSSGTFNGENFHYGEMQASTGVVLDPGPTQLERVVYEAAPYTFADYMPGGRAAQYAAAEGMYHYYSGNLQINTNPKPVVLEGLIVVENTLSIIGDNYTIGPKGLTVVAGGKIIMSATNITLKPYIDNLLLFALETSTCGNNSITLSSSTTVWMGIIYAPYGGVRFSDSGNSTESGGITAQTISISSSNTNITRNPGVSILLPPNTSLAQ